jgi:hypothetical protein
VYSRVSTVGRRRAKTGGRWSCDPAQQPKLAAVSCSVLLGGARPW